MNWYQFKKIVLKPYIWYKRYRERHQAPFMKNMMEQHYYRPTFYGFVRATILNRDIMYEAPLNKGDIVLDLGAYHGKWASRVYELYQPRIYMYEPDPPSVRKLQNMFAGNDDVELREYGLGARDDQLEMIQKGMGSSFYGKNTGGHNVVTVPVRDVAAELEALGHEQIDLIKLNIEGGEYDVMERLIETGWMPRVRIFMIQFHEWFDGAHRRHRRIHRELRKTHDVAWRYPFIWEQWVRKENQGNAD